MSYPITIVRVDAGHFQLLSNLSPAQCVFSESPVGSAALAPARAAAEALHHARRHVVVSDLDFVFSGVPVLPDILAILPDILSIGSNVLLVLADIFQVTPWLHGVPIRPEILLVRSEIAHILPEILAVLPEIDPGMMGAADFGHVPLSFDCLHWGQDAFHELVIVARPFQILSKVG